MTSRDRAFLKLPDLPDKPYPYANILAGSSWHRRLNYSTLFCIGLLVVSVIGWIFDMGWLDNLFNR